QRNRQPRPRCPRATATTRAAQPRQPPPAADGDRSWPFDVGACSLLLLAPQLLEPRIASAIEPVEFVADRILHVEILVIFPALGNRPRRHDWRIDRLLEPLLHRRFRALRQPALLVVAIEDGGAVLIAAIAELAILHQRIDVVPEHVE